MAESTITNIANIEGSYDGIPTALQSNALATLMVSGLTITKTADKSVWAAGELTYTITVTNSEDKDYENPTVTDTLTPSIVRLVDNSVTIGGNAAVPDTDYRYDSISGLLSVNLATVGANSSTIITFRVRKV